MNVLYGEESADRKREKDRHTPSHTYHVIVYIYKLCIFKYINGERKRDRQGERETNLINEITENMRVDWGGVGSRGIKIEYKIVKIIA